MQDPRPATFFQHALEALNMWKSLGISFKHSNVEVKLIHPNGRNSFRQHGIVFVDCFPESGSTFFRFVMLFANQSMPAHLHRERVEEFTVVAGDLFCFLEGEDEEKKILPGEVMAPKIGQLHEVWTSGKGALFVGECDLVHLQDVHCKESKTDERATVFYLCDLPYHELNIGPKSEVCKLIERFEIARELKLV